MDEYRAVSGMAVAGLVFGMLSPAAMFDPVGFAAPALGILLCAAALWRVARHAPELIGRKAAMLGLVLAVFFGFAATGQWGCYHWLLRQQARQTAEAWFQLQLRHP